MQQLLSQDCPFRDKLSTLTEEGNQKQNSNRKSESEISRCICTLTERRPSSAMTGWLWLRKRAWLRLKDKSGVRVTSVMVIAMPPVTTKRFELAAFMCWKPWPNIVQSWSICVSHMRRATSIPMPACWGLIPTGSSAVAGGEIGRREMSPQTIWLQQADN